MKAVHGTGSQCFGQLNEETFEIVKWLHSEGCPWSEDTCEAADMSGNMDMLQWILSQGCPWNEEVFDRSHTNEMARLLCNQSFAEPG